MKKLMTAFAACMIAGLVTASVQSRNIVGYQTSTAATGFTVYAPTFTACGVTNPVFGLITGNFAFADNLQFFDASGNVVFTAMWDDGTINPEAGWYTDDFANSLATTEIPIGQGFFVSTASDVSMVVAGEVNNTNVVVECGAGFTVMGNPRPYAITYGNLQCTNMSFADNLQFFDATGNVSFTAMWDDGTINPEPGWYTDDFGSSLAATEIPAGQGFFFSSANGGTTCTIPVLH